MKLGRLNHIGVATQPKPLTFRGGVGVGSFGIAQGPRNPTPLRLARKRVSLAAPPLKGRGERMKFERLNHIGAAVQPKPLTFRGGVGVGSLSVAQGLQNPTPLRLARKRVSLAAPPLKGRG
jgi:hypothetical protein